MVVLVVVLDGNHYSISFDRVAMVGIIDSPTEIY